MKEAEVEVAELIADYEALEANVFPRHGSKIAEENHLDVLCPQLFPSF